MTFLPQNFGLTIQSFGVAAAVIVAALAAVVVFGILETVRQEIKPKREQRRGAANTH